MNLIINGYCNTQNRYHIILVMHPYTKALFGNSSSWAKLAVLSNILHLDITSIEISSYTCKPTFSFPRNHKTFYKILNL